jgi:hypothetical protein
MSVAGETARARRYAHQERELAYRVWCQCQQNLAETLRRLDADHEWPLAKQTLADWRDAGGWSARAAAEAAEALRRARAETLDRSAMLAGIDLQLQRYEELFARAHAQDDLPDPKATQAYANLARLRLSTLRDMEAGAGVSRLELAMEVLRCVSELVREDFPGHAAVWLEVLEPAGQRLAELYG